jgi:hypothetical protein
MMSDTPRPGAFAAIAAGTALMALSAALPAHGAMAETLEVRPGAMDPDATERAGRLPLGHVAKWENYTPDGRFFAETTMTLAVKSGDELVWDVRHDVLADQTISAIIRQAAQSGQIRVVRDDADGLAVVGIAVTDRRMRFKRKDTAFGTEINQPHDCAYTFSLCRFTRTMPDGAVFPLVRWGELRGGVWITRVNHDPWKDPEERRTELFNGQASVAEDGLALDDIEIWDGEVLSILRRITE